MATYTGQLRDFLPSELATLNPHLWVQLNRPGMGPSGPLTTVRKPVELTGSQTFEFDVEPSVNISPQSAYTLGVTWANGRDMDVLEFVAKIGGGPIKDSVSAPASVWIVGPPWPAVIVPGAFYLDRVTNEVGRA